MQQYENQNLLNYIKDRLTGISKAVQNYFYCEYIYTSIWELDIIVLTYV